MDAANFVACVALHPDLVGIGIDGSAAVVQYKPSGLLTRVEASAVASYEWEQLEPILCGRSEPQRLRHIARVCGYYSRAENWNKSKIGELHDRHAGAYTLPE